MKINYKNIEHKKIWFDSMIGMTWGFIATLIVGTIIGMFGYGQNNWWSLITNTTKDALSYLTPFGIGIGIGLKLKLNPIKIFALGIGSFLVAHSMLTPSISSTKIDWTNAKVGITLFKGISGDVFAAWLSSVLLAYIFSIFQWSIFIDIFLVPIIGFLIGVIGSLSITYITSTILVSIEWIINNSANKLHWVAILLAPIIGGLMGLALSLPTSSAAIAM